MDQRAKAALRNRVLVEDASASGAEMPHSTCSNPLLRIRLLGVLQVTLACDPMPRVLALPHGPVARLLGYLSLYAPVSIPRSRLAGLLNPDMSEASARRALSDAVYRLRRELGDAARCIQAEADSLSLQAGSFWSDVQEFRQRVASPLAEDWQRALDLYSGDLLEDEDAEWLLAPRAQLREEFIAAHERVYEDLKENRWAEALAYAHRWTLADPLSEQAQQAAMQLYARLGRPAAALEQYERFVRRLADELNATPLAETRLLADAIRSEYAAALDQPSPPRKFVGRRKERTLLLQAAEQTLKGEGGLVLVEGEPGVGKTRLLETFAQGAAWRGLTVVWGRAREYSARAPYAPLGEALVAALAGPRADQVRQRLDPAVAQAAAFWSPRLQPNPPLKLSSAPDLDAVLDQVLQALTRLAPHVLIFDDVQWADVNFWSAIQHVAPLLASQRLLIVMSYRSEDLRADVRAWEHLRKLDAEYLVPKVLLRGLTANECRELARAAQPMLEENDLQSLFECTGGNPLYLSEALEQADHTSPSFRHLLERRWGSLPVAAQDALRAAAVLGRNLAHGEWQAIVGPGLLEQIPLLVTTRFLAETEQGYAFQHDLTREFVYGTLTPQRRRELHLGAGHAREAARAEPAVLAWHFEQAQDWHPAVRYLREAGDYAEKRDAYYSALDYYTRALELADHLDEPDSEKLAILSRCPEVARACGKIPEWRQATKALKQVARRCGDQAALLLGLEAEVELCVFALDWERMQGAAMEAITLAQKIGNMTAEARLRNEFGFQLCDALGKWDEARMQLERALELAGVLDDRDLAIRAYCNLALVQRLAGSCGAAKTTVERVLALVDGHPGERTVRAEVLGTSGLIHAQLANWEAARTVLLQAVELGQELGDMSLLGPAVFDLGIACARMGQHAEARHWIDYYMTKYAELGGNPEQLPGRWIRALSGNAYVLAGDLKQARQVFTELGPWIETETAGRQLLLALTGLGQLELAENNSREALRHLERATRIWETMRGSEIAPLLLHALAAKRCGDPAGARASLRRAEEALQGTDVAQYNVLSSYVRYELSGESADLEAAHTEIERQAAGISDERRRADFYGQVQLHREIEQLRQERHLASRVTIAQLARSDAHLGKKLSHGERVPVHWTVDDGPADAGLARSQGKVALRRHRVRRLLEEAHAQGALPTDEDLASALDVDRRTILRDMAWLAANGHPTLTRRRKNGSTSS